MIVIQGHRLVCPYRFSMPWSLLRIKFDWLIDDLQYTFSRLHLDWSVPGQRPEFAHIMQLDSVVSAFSVCMLHFKGLECLQYLGSTQTPFLIYCSFLPPITLLSIRSDQSSFPTNGVLTKKMSLEDCMSSGLSSSSESSIDISAKLRSNQTRLKRTHTMDFWNSIW